MMYVLTQEELDELKKARKHELHLSRKKLQDLCTKLAETSLLRKVYWRGSWILEKAEGPQGCILTKTSFYCDHCPVEDICPSDRKEHSQ